MPSWHEISQGLKEAGTGSDIYRKQFISELSNLTNRNTIIYYSGWLQKPGIRGSEVNDSDKNGFMAVIHGLDRSKGLDLILHTQGGEVAATESLIDYLYSMFKGNIRAIVPQIAMSAGTMIACACKSIIMGKHSSLGPVDPQFSGLPAHGVMEEFERAYKEIKGENGQIDNAKIHLWQPIIAKYPPAFIGECEKAIEWSNEIVSECLKRGMFVDDSDSDRDIKIQKIVEELGDHSMTKSHSRHLSSERCKSLGLSVIDLESDQALQDSVLSVHHAAIHSLSSTQALKIIENQDGVSFIQVVKQVNIQ